MPIRHTLNIGILAHVDAGKTSLTERLLFDTGAIARLGSVDGGNTQTDTGAIERERGITVRSAVVAFTVGDAQVNLIDTPGHPDFIAEVERALGVLDGVVLVLSAVEGVQAQTRVLMRTVREMRLPALLFVNKIDRTGARDEGLLAEVRRTIAPNVISMTRTIGLGTRAAEVLPEFLDDPGHRARVAEVLADTDDRMLARVVDGPPLTAVEVADALGDGTAAGRVHPLFAGSALSGAGVGALLDGIMQLLPPAPADADAELRGTVFAVERTLTGEKVAYLRLFAGEIGPRQRVVIRRLWADGAGEERAGRVTSVRVVGQERAGRLTAGHIGRIGGLDVKVGDRIGAVDGDDGYGDDAAPRIARPTLRTVVRPRDPAHATRLHTALLSLADEDPLIHAQVAPGGTEVLLHGEVQKEVIAERLLAEHGVEAGFTPSRIVCVERPVGVGEAAEEFGRRGPALDRFWATVGLRVEPGPRNTGVVFRYETELGALPRAFHTAIEETVHLASRQGPQGWAVTDCVVTLVRSGFDAPTSVAADFRGLTSIVLMQALERARTRVYEPYHAFELEIPTDVLSKVAQRLTALGARIAETAGDASRWRLAGTVPVRRLDAVQRSLPGITHGEAVWWTRPSADQPVDGAPP